LEWEYIITKILSKAVILFQGQPINQMQILDCLVYQSGISILSIVPIIIGIIILIISIVFLAKGLKIKKYNNSLNNYWFYFSQ